MKLGFFTMPIHPLEKDWRVSLREDREAFILADELGYTEGYLGERAALQHRGQVLEHRAREAADARSRPGTFAQALAAAASADRRHGGRAVLQGRDGSRGARLGSDLGELPDAAMGQVALAEIR